MNTLRATPQEILDAARLSCPAWASEIETRLAAHLLDVEVDGATEGKDNVNKTPDADPMAHQHDAPGSLERDRWHVIAEEGNPEFPQLAELTILWPEDGSRLVTTAWCGTGGWSGQWGARKLEEYGAIPLAWRELPEPWMGEVNKKGDTP